MCGRFTLIVPTYEMLAQSLGVVADPAQAAVYRPRYNIAPSDSHWVLRMREGKRLLLQEKWGLIPRWAKRADAAGKPINARSETMEHKPAFRDAFSRRRCVVVADGFFEWKKEGKERRPLWFTPRDGGLMLMAGLDAKWTDPATGDAVRTFTIVTTAANDTVAPVHDRMPVILYARDVDAWIDVPAYGEKSEITSELRALLRPLPETWLVATPVSQRVNSVKNDDAGCIAPADDREAPIDLGRPGIRSPGAGETMPLFPLDAPVKPRPSSRARAKT